MLLCVCSVTDHRRRQNVIRTSVTHLPDGLYTSFLFLPHFDVICDLILNRSMTRGIFFCEIEPIFALELHQNNTFQTFFEWEAMDEHSSSHLGDVDKWLGPAIYCTQTCLFLAIVLFLFILGSVSLLSLKKHLKNVFQFE